MVSLLHNQSFQKFSQQQRFACQQKSQSFVAFGLNEKQPNHFTEVIPNRIYTGGIIENQDQLDFLCNRKFNSILNLVTPDMEKNPYMEKCGNAMEKERTLIRENNADESRRFLSYKTLPIWTDLLQMDPRESDDKEILKRKLTDAVNKLEPPIYIHCISGRLISREAAKLIEESAKEGKLDFTV